MGPRHTRDDILAGALATAFQEGLSRLTYGRVARQLGINDRTVAYYFPTTDDLAAQVVMSMAAQLQTTLAPAFATPSADHRELLRAAWPVLAHPDADPVFALFFEANGLALAGRSPYRALVPQLVEGWIDWVTRFVVGSDDHRRAEAEAAIAVLDGLLLLRQLAGPDAADRAIARVAV